MPRNAIQATFFAVVAALALRGSAANHHGRGDGGAYVEDVLTPIANAAISIGPLTFGGTSRGTHTRPPGSSRNMTRGPFIKMGYAGGEKWMTGHMYIFNNTIFQEDDNGADGLGGGSRSIKHCATRNNTLHVREGGRRSIAVSRSHVDNDFDHDLTSAAFPENHEKQGLKGSLRYMPGAG